MYRIVIGEISEEGMRVILNYDGEIGSGRRPHVESKHTIRKQIHPQLKRLWQIEPALQWIAKSPHHPSGPELERIADQFTVGAFRFVPLVRKELDLVCSLSVVFMRPMQPGRIIAGNGDLDNQVKTLFDALSMPQCEQVRKFSPENDGSENPFYCLLEDDSLITGIEVKGECLLRESASNPNAVD